MSENRRSAERRKVATSVNAGAKKRARARTARVPSGTAVEAKASDITSISALFEWAYSLQGKQIKVPQAVFKAISSAQASTLADLDASVSQLCDLTANDSLLAVPPRLLTAIETSNNSPLLRRQLIDLLIAALDQHPVFRSEKARMVLTGEAANIDDAFVSVGLVCSDVSATDLGIESTSLTASDREKLRANAITSLALLLSARDEWSVAELVERLEVYLWRYLAKKPEESASTSRRHRIDGFGRAGSRCLRLHDPSRRGSAGED